MYETVAADDAAKHDEHAEHDAHHEEVEFLEALNPPPSYWPLLLSLALGLLPIGTVMILVGGRTEAEGLSLAGWIVAALGFVLSVVPALGWCHSVIVDKWMSHFGPVAQGRDLVLGTLLFFISEIAIFGSIFAYYFVIRHHFSSQNLWPLEGSPDPEHWNVMLPAVGLLLLLTSSVTCEFGHKAMIAGKRGVSKNWMIITIVLGLIFLALQGFEWGEFIQRGFTVSSNTFGTVFYTLTGFHGFHVMTGLIMLILVYGRLEIGHYTPKRHFSLMAASWYWHLVDVVWVFVFVFIYAWQ